ncbi:hypothetical protein [uncultured Salinicola sp.]|uniref:hypothetical protein n=1 Tax=uncultured Salinicola sp. TaxID=1193542 RepID=UPI0026047AE1|nr:hypothetical protein [uncultured Salinicola sp.]|tara:strand:+ start:9875 stop:10273 length:399 start_codon:yes stop_codon:yes gene_type:complete
MNIIHDSTIKTAKGWQTIIRVEGDDHEIGLVIRHDAPTSKVLAHDMEVIESAIARETIIDRREVMDTETASKIEESLIEWISNELGEQHRHIRWRDEQMFGFDTRTQAEEFAQASLQGEVPRAPRKKRIMLG